jgi:hypothetical protein
MTSDLTKYFTELITSMESFIVQVPDSRWGLSLVIKRQWAVLPQNFSIDFVQQNGEKKVKNGAGFTKLLHL